MLGEAAIPFLAQSCITLGAVLAETEVVDKASKEGDGSGLSLSGAAVGLISGVLMGGEEALEVGMLFGVSFPLSSPSLTGLLFIHKHPVSKPSCSNGIRLCQRPRAARKSAAERVSHEAEGHALRCLAMGHGGVLAGGLTRTCRPSVWSPLRQCRRCALHFSFPSWL